MQKSFFKLETPQKRTEYFTTPRLENCSPDAEMPATREASSR